MSENALNILSEETFIEQTEQIIELLKGKHLEPLPIKPDDTGKIVWINLDDGMYIIDSTGVIEDGADGITMNKNDVLFKNGNDAYLYTASFAGKLTYNHETGSYKSYLFSITAEQLEELIEEIHGGGAPVEHDHPVSDIYIEQIFGGAWDTDFYKLQNVELVEAIKNDEEIMAYIEEKQTTPEEFIANYIQLFDSEIITDSNGNSYIPFGMMISKSLLKAKIAPNSSFNDLDFGTVAKIPTTFDGEDLSQITLESCNKQIICGVGEHEYQPVAATDINDLFTMISNGYPDPDNQEEVDAWLRKYGSKTIAVSLHPTDENGEDIDYTFSDIMTDDSLNGLAFNYIGFVAPVSDLEELMNTENEEEGMSAIKFHFDAVEEETITKLPLSEDIAKKITALTDRDSQLEEKINQVKNMDINLDRIVKKETTYYGGEYSNMVYAFNSNSYANNLYSTEQTALELNDKMTGNRENYQDRMKMGSVFELTYDEQTSKPVYTYLGTASEQNGLSYSVEFNGNTGTEKALTSLDDFLDGLGYFNFNEENMSVYLQNGEYTFVTIINNGSVDKVYGAFNGEKPFIRIDEVMPMAQDISTQRLSSIIDILQEGINDAKRDASSAESIAVNAQATAETANNTANGAQSTANGAQSTADSAQSTADSAKQKANDAHIRAENAATAASAAQIRADNAYTKAENAETAAGTAQQRANNAYTKAENAETAAGTAQQRADNAYTKAGTAQTKADNAYTKAGTAQTKADSAYTKAEDSVSKKVMVPFSTTTRIDTLKQWFGSINNNTLNLPCFDWEWVDEDHHIFRIKIPYSVQRGFFHFYNRIADTNNGDGDLSLVEPTGSDLTLTQAEGILESNVTSELADGNYITYKHGTASNTSYSYMYVHINALDVDPNLFYLRVPNVHYATVSVDPEKIFASVVSAYFFFTGDVPFPDYKPSTGSTGTY